MTRKNNINIVETTEFVEGIIVELSKTNLNAIDVKRYFINEYKEMEKTDLGEIFIGEIYPCAKSLKEAIDIVKRKVKSMTKEKKQKVYLSVEVFELLSNVLK